MHSRFTKHFKIWLLLVIAVFALLSCSFFFDKKEVLTEFNYVNDDSTSCIGGANRGIQKYFDIKEVAPITDQEIDSISHCYERAIQSFITHTKSGREASENYSAENIELLINKFHPEVQITVEKISFYLRIKQFFFGGTVDSVSKKELKNLLSVVPAISKTLKVLRPHREIIYYKQTLKRDEASYKIFMNSFRTLAEQANILLQALEPYSGSRKIDLIEVIRKFYISDNVDYADAAVGFKNLVINSSGPFLDRQDFPLLIQQSIEAGKALSEFYYFVQDEYIFTNIGFILSFPTRIQAQLQNARVFDAESLKTLEAVKDIFDTGEEILLRSAEVSKSKQIPIERIQEFLVSLQSAGFLSDTLGAEPLTSFISELSKTYLDPGAAPSSEITPEKLKYLKKMMDKWFYRQNYINSNLIRDGSGKIKYPLTQDELNANPEFLNWLEIFKQSSVHQWNRDHRVVFSEVDEGISYEEMTVANSLAILIELFMRPFNLDKKNITHLEITANQTQQIYEVMRILGVEMKIMDSRSYDSGERSFMEANNFTSRSRVDSHVDFLEAFDLLSISLSAAGLADYIYNSFDGKCKGDYLDVHNYTISKVGCFRAEFFKNFSDYFNHLETVNRYWEKINYGQRLDFIHTLESAARGGIFDGKNIDIGEIRMMVSILYYLESIFYRFEFGAHQDGVAQGQEIINAEQHFRPLIRNLISKNDKIDDLYVVLSPLSSYVPNFSRENLADWLNQREDAVFFFSKLTKEELIDWLTPRLFLYLLTARGSWISHTLPLELIDIINMWILYRGDLEASAAGISADVADVLQVFKESAKNSHDTQVKNILKFLNENYLDLFNSLRFEKPPQNCRVSLEISVFCQWSRIINCTDSASADLYHWMQMQKYNIFPDRLWETDRDEAVATAMGRFNIDFPRNLFFSTKCNFPRFEDKMVIESAKGESLRDIIESEQGRDRTQKGLRGYLDWPWNW